MNASSKMGQVLVDGIALDIFRISLEKGEVVLSCSKLGPVPGRTEGPAVVTVMAPDGSGIAQWDAPDTPGWPEVPAGSILTITQSLRARQAFGT